MSVVLEKRNLYPGEEPAAEDRELMDAGGEGDRTDRDGRAENDSLCPLVAGIRHSPI
jgi:hypothetical protein